jgi:hypothetical protein
LSILSRRADLTSLPGIEIIFPSQIRVANDLEAVSQCQRLIRKSRVEYIFTSAYIFSWVKESETEFFFANKISDGTLSAWKVSNVGNERDLCECCD